MGFRMCLRLVLRVTGRVRVRFRVRAAGEPVPAKVGVAAGAAKVSPGGRPLATAAVDGERASHRGHRREAGDQAGQDPVDGGGSEPPALHLYRRRWADSIA